MEPGKAFEKAAQLEPGDPSYRKKIEEIRAQLKREEAHTQNKAKEEAASQYKQGNAFFSSKQYEKALTAFTEAVRLQPSNAEYQSARGRTLHTLKRYEQALAAYNTQMTVVTPPVTHRANTVAGLIGEIGLRTVIGLLVGIGLAFVIDYVDPSVRTREEAETLLQTPVLGQIPRTRRGVAA